MVFGVKEPLIVDFIKNLPGKAPNGETLYEPFYEVKYDFKIREGRGRAKGGVTQIGRILRSGRSPRLEGWMAISSFASSTSLALP